MAKKLIVPPLTSLFAIGDIVCVNKTYFNKPQLTGLIGTITHIYTRDWTKDDMIEIADVNGNKILFLNSNLVSVPKGA